MASAAASEGSAGGESGHPCTGASSPFFMKGRTFSAPGKLVLAGEYAVCEGFSGLSAAVCRRAHITATPAAFYEVSSPQEGRLLFKMGSGGQLEILGEQKNLFSLFFMVCDEVLKGGYEILPRQFYLNTEALYGVNEQKNLKLGLGSSCALTVALVAELITKAGASLDKDTIFKLALRVHQRFTGYMGSGMDVATSCFGGLVHFIWPCKEGVRELLPVIKPMLPPAEIALSLLPVFTGICHSTTSLMQEVSKLKQAKRHQYKVLMQKLGDCSLALQQSLFSHHENKPLDWATLMNILQDNLNALKELGCLAQIPLLTKPHEEIDRLARKEGGIAKPSGAGGGDVSICWVKADRRGALRQKIKEAGFVPLSLDLFASGVQMDTIGG